jgi:N-acetylmuramoyl-L-alanine amidase
VNKIILSALAAVSFLGLSSFDKKRVIEKSKALFSNYEIFGGRHAATQHIDNKLVDEVYYIISGHGGPDPGANTVVNGKHISEDEYAYDVSLRLAKNLISHGSKVYMIVRDENDGIRDDEYLEMDRDEVVWGGEAIPVNQAQRLKQRTNIINNLYRENLAKGYTKQRVIETHVDSRHTDNKVDIFFYYNQNKKESQELASAMYETIKEKYDNKQKGRGYNGVVNSRNLWTIKESKPPVVYIELGNITNEYDRRRLLQPDNRQAIANWFTQGLLNY